MKSLEEKLLKETLMRTRSNTRAASLFGSFRRGDYDSLSDVDIFIICEDEAEKNLIRDMLWKTSIKISREIHPTIFTLDEYGKRLRNYDYLVASILEDSKFLLGDEDAFFKDRKEILTSKPNMGSIRFNRNLGLEILRRTKRYFDNASIWKTSTLNHSETDLRFLLEPLRFLHLGIGYLLASEEMKRLNKTITLKHTLRYADSSVLREIITVEKKIKQEDQVNLLNLRNLIRSLPKRTL